MPLINCEVNFILTWSANSVVWCEGNRQIICGITDRKLYVSVVSLSNQDNTKLLQELKSGFKLTINWINMNQKEQHRIEANI